MSALKKKRKPMVPLKTLDIIFRRRYVPNTQHYFANRKHAVKKDAAQKKPLKPFRVPRSEKLLSYIKYSDRKEKLTTRERLTQPLHLKDNLRIAATRDISERLFVEEPVDDVRAVVEIHPEFYTVIEGRPLRCFDDIKVYLNNIRAYAMNRQQIGYRRDLILKIDKTMVEESDHHDRIVSKLKQHIKNFQKFLTEDYKKACMKVSLAEKVYADLLAKNSEFLGYVSTLTILNNILFKLDAIRSILKMYRSYLMFVAPLSWRQQHDETLSGRIQSIQFEAGVFATDNDLVESLDIEKMVEIARNELKHPLPAKMYFQKPAQMIYLFRSMELQSREYLKYLAKTDGPTRQLRERIKELKLATVQELDYFQYYIDRINGEISRESFNETLFRDKFFRILNETFYDSIASPATLKLRICVEYVYEQIFGKCEEGHHSIHDPMKILEVMYEDYNLRLDALDFKIVNQARNDFFAQDLKMMQNAYKAQRELRAFREMTNAMNKAFLPPAKHTRPVLKKIKDKNVKVKKSVPLVARKSGERIKPKKHKLSQEEREGLILFTDWCEGVNPTPYLHEYYTYTKPAFDWISRKSIDDYIYMADEDGRTIVIDIQKPRTYDISCKHKVVKKKKVVPRQPKQYLLPKIPTVLKPVAINTVRRESVLLPYLRYSRKQEKDRFKERLGIGISEDYKIAYTDLRNRLYIEDPPDDCRGLTDYDPDFFTCVKSSLLSSYVAPYKSLKYLFNSQIRWRQEVGYRRDCMLNIDVNYEKEQQVYDSSVKRCMKQVKYLDDFISADYKKSMSLLNKSEHMALIVFKKASELQCLAAEKFTMASKILGLDYRYGLQQKYGRFLYYLSPPSWRMKNRNFARSIEIEAKGFDFGISSEEDTFNVIFEKLKSECDNGLVKPVLYFEHPDDLMKIFDGIEQQQLNNFTHVVRLAPHTRILKSGIKHLKDIIAQDSAGVVTLIKDFEKMLLFCEEQSSLLQGKFFKILNGLFYDSVGAADVLKFQMHLEFCYAKVYNEKPMNLGIMGTAKALEDFYMDFSKRMESITAENITTAVKQSVELERRKFKRAKVAARELRLFERLERALLRAYAPMDVIPCPLNFQMNVRGHSRKSKPTSSKATTVDKRKIILTESELEYLSLFTDWTEKEDPGNYLRSLSMEDDEQGRRSTTY